MKGRAKGRERTGLQEETEKAEIDELEGGKEWKDELDGTLAASEYSQEDYLSTRCHRLPGRRQRSSLNEDTQHERAFTSLWMSPHHILVLPTIFGFTCFSLCFRSVPTVCSLPPFLLLSVFDHSHFLVAVRERGHKQVAHAPTSGFFILWQEQSFLAREKKIYRRTPSLSHLSLFNQQESSGCPHLSFSFFF